LVLGPRVELKFFSSVSKDHADDLNIIQSVP
jgi:hypothetical protein